MTFFRKLFGRRAESAAAVDVAPGPAVLPEKAAPDAAAAAPTANGNEKPAVKASAPMPVPTREDWVSLRLKDITDLFTDEMKQSLKKQPSEHVVIYLRKDFILPKLAAGAVRITFAELRAATPEVFFHVDKVPAETKLLLPLQILLGQVKPPRRADQKQVAMPVTVPSIFAKEGQRVLDAAKKKDGWYTPRKVNLDEPGMAACAAETTPAPVEERVLKMPGMSESTDPSEAAAASMKIEEPAADVATSEPEKEASAADIEKAAAEYAAKIEAEAEPAVEAAVEPAVQLNAEPAVESAAEAAVEPTVGPTVELTFGQSAEPAVEPAAESAAETAVESAIEPEVKAEEKPEEKPATGGGDSFLLGFSIVREVLPEGVREALNGSVPPDAAFRIPMEEFEARMRTGKVVFKWGRLREWCDATLGGDADTDIELPLAGVVPIFMAARTKGPEARKRVEVDARIPEVFGKTDVKVPAVAPAVEKAPEPAPAQAPVAVAEASPVSGAAPAPAAATDLPKPAGALLDTVAAAAVGAIPDTATANGPANVVAELRKLEGIAGAFIATADGLLVAGDVPGSNANVLAAFAPTVFAQLTKYSGMAKLGLPETLDLQLDGGTKVHVRKTGKLYLGVLADRGAVLPGEELARIAGTL